ANEFASNRDRHTNIGEGTIGVEPFRWLFRDRRSFDVPLILETPEQNPSPDPDDPSADPWHVEMLELLRSFDLCRPPARPGRHRGRCRGCNASWMGSCACRCSTRSSARMR